MTERAKRHLERFRDKCSSRGVWDATFDDLARVMLPGRLGFSTTVVPGEIRTADLYDGTAMQAARGLARATDYMLWPDGEKAFYIKSSDDKNDDEAKDWLADTEQKMHDAMADPKARFRQARGERSLDRVVFGTGIIYESEGRKLNRLLFQCISLKDAYPYWDEEGNAAGMYRRRMLTVEQAVDKFTLGKVSNDVREKWRQGKFDEKVEYLHCVTPRKEGRPDAVMSANFPYTDLWIDVLTQEEALDGGFREFPFIVSRWDTSSGEDYGSSEAMIALPDANTAQAMGETILVAGQRAADPPLATPFDGFFTEYNTFPGGLVHYDVDTAMKLGRIPIQPIESGTNLPISRDMQNDTREQIWAAFLRNILNLPVPGPNMTATEIMQRKEEMIREVGPVFGRLETDDKAPIVERSFRLMFRAGAFLPVPESLQGKGIRFEYESPIKKIRQQIEAQAASLWVHEHIQIAAETGNPDVLDNVNFDEYSRISHEAAALPHAIRNGDEKKAALRQQRMEQQQAAAEMAAGQQIAESAGKAAPALKVLQGGAA